MASTFASPCCRSSEIREQPQRAQLVVYWLPGTGMDICTFVPGKTLVSQVLGRILR